jgi:hypothetical protein
MEGEVMSRRPIRPFWDKVQRGAPDECWPWLGYKKASGHGLTSYKSVPTHASRKAWILTHGPIDSALCVNHKCDNAACCNPAHMYLGTRADNMVDMWLRPPGSERAIGRKRTLTDEQLTRLWEMRRGGRKLRECAKEFNVHIATVCRYITEIRRARFEKLRAVRLSGSRV